MVGLGKIENTGSISLSTSIFRRADKQQQHFQKLFTIWHSPFIQYRSWFTTTATVNSQTQLAQKANKLFGMQLPYKTTISTLKTSTQLQSTDNTDGSHRQKFHDNNKHFSKNNFSSSSSIFRTAVNSVFNSRSHQGQVRHNCRYERVHKLKISVFLRSQLNTTSPTESSAAEAGISFSATSEATNERKRRRRDDEDRFRTKFNSNRSNTNFLISVAQKWGPTVLPINRWTGRCTSRRVRKLTGNWTKSGSYVFSATPSLILKQLSQIPNYYRQWRKTDKNW